MTEATVFAVAHPDDLETMLGYMVQRTGGELVAVVATNGTASTENNTNDPRHVSMGYRQFESVQGLRELGIGTSYHLSLPDGELHTQHDNIVQRLAFATEGVAVRRIVTLGSNGYCGHSDHIAVHNAAVDFARTMQKSDQPEIYALNHKHEGIYKIEATPQMLQRKLAAMACHYSQFGIYPPWRPLGEGRVPDEYVAIHDYNIPRSFWQDFAHFQPLVLKGETYDIVK